jgi:hypothetical protein
MGETPIQSWYTKSIEQSAKSRACERGGEEACRSDPPGQLYSLPHSLTYSLTPSPYALACARLGRSDPPGRLYSGNPLPFITLHSHTLRRSELKCADKPEFIK